MTSHDFSGQVALITGAARGIGRASALAFARRGANVILCDVLDEDGAETVAAVESLGTKAVYLHTDVSDPDAVQAAVATALDRFGRLDYAHNNAGIVAIAATADLALADWNRVLQVNLTGIFLCLKYEIPPIIEAGGAIVNTASIWGHIGAAGQAAYAASKHGVVGLTKSAAADYGQSGIRINAIAPGTIDTPMTADVPRAVMQPTIDRSVQKRLGRADEVAEAAVWLCSPAASYVNGTVLAVDGGWLAS